MDGGTGSELQRRGVEVLLGSRGDKLGPWSATANLDAPDVVQQVHQDYLRVGADIIISNNFRTTRTRLAPVGLGERWKEYAEAGGRLAVRARDAINPEAYVAGGMAAPGLGMLNDRSETDVAIMGDQEYRREFAEHSKVLAATGVDVMLPEFVNYIDDCVAAVDACAEAGRPVWLGVPMVTTEGITRNGETMEDLGARAAGPPRPGDPPHVQPPGGRQRHPAAAPPGLRRADRRVSQRRLQPDGPGRGPRPPRAGPHLGPGPPARPSWRELAQEWIEMGAQIVGRLLRDGTRAHHGHEGRRRRRPAREAPRASAEAPAMRIVETLPRRVQEIENIWIPVGTTGHRMAARLWLPEGAEQTPVPAILTYLPYRKRDSTRAGDDPMHRYFSGHGYACLRVDMRGSGDSDGLMDDEYAPQELHDGKDLIAWIAGPALVHRQGRHDRQLLGGLQRAPDRRPPAAGARRDHHELLDRRSVRRRHALHGRMPPQRHARLGLVVLRPPAPAAGPGDLGPGLAAEVAGAARAVRLAAGRVAPAPAAGQLLEARLGQRGLRRDPVPRLRDRRLDGRLLERDPAAARAPLGAAPRAHRRLGPQVRPSGRRRGRRSAISRSASAGGTTGSGAGTPGSCASRCCGPSCRRRCRRRGDYPVSPGRWVAEPVWPPRAPNDPAASTSTRAARSGPGPGAPSRSRTGRSRRSASRGGEWCPHGIGGYGPQCPTDQREDDVRSLVFETRAAPPAARDPGSARGVRSRSPWTSRWRSSRSGSTTSFPTAACPG